MEILTRVQPRFIVFALLATALTLGGCVPSPNSNDDAYPQFSLLSTFYAPRDSSTVLVWRDSSVAAHSASTILHRYAGVVPTTFAAPYSSASRYILTDSASGSTSTLDVVVTDTIVLESLSLGSSVNAVSRLSGLLAVGSRWVACGNLITSNGTAVSLSATVDNYFASTSVGGQSFAHVYHVSYEVTDVFGQNTPLEPEYQKGATLGVYYAKLIGPTYMVWKDGAGQTLRISQLVETRAR